MNLREKLKHIYTYTLRIKIIRCYVSKVIDIQVIVSFKAKHIKNQFLTVKVIPNRVNSHVLPQNKLSLLSLQRQQILETINI